ncbi:hypothetical protein PENSPDRAFT_595471, partial [Peniophora sp. CONT]
STGSSQLLQTARACNDRRGVIDDELTTKTHGDPSNLDGEIIPRYTEAGVRAILALWCARSSRPFSIVADFFLRALVTMLLPGTILPTPSTVLTDLKTIHLHVASRIRHYFEVNTIRDPHIACISS